MLSKRISNVKKSFFLKYNDIIKKREQCGVKFYKLNIGQPDFNTDELYFESLSKFKMKVNSYGDPAGLDILKKSVSQYYNNLYNQIKLKTENIIVTQGASDAIIKILYCICDHKDEIIVIEPFFADYKMYCDMLNIKIKPINNNELNIASLEKKITNKTKAILFSNPNNPDGAIISENFICELMEVAIKHDLLVISDEVYSGLIYSDDYVSFANYLGNNVILVDSASKKLNLCGSRIGYIISKNEELNDKLILLNDCRISISNVEQFAVGNMLQKSDTIIMQSKIKYQERINKILDKVRSTKIKCIVPSGGLSMILELPFYTEKYVEWLIKKYEKNNYSLLVVPGSNFYISEEGKNKIRICVTLNDRDIEKAIELLIDSCIKYEEEEI